EADPITKDLFCVSIEAGEVRRIVYTAANRPPIVAIAAQRSTGRAPLQVQFSSTGTFDPDADPITYEWDFGDGSPVDSSPDPAHVYVTSDSFAATLTVRDNRGGAASKALPIVTSNSAPQVSIVSPAPGAGFYGGEEITLRADASDL